MISTYASAEKYMSKARNKSAGRAMVNNHWRMHQDGNECVEAVRPGYVQGRPPVKHRQSLVGAFQGTDQRTAAL